MKKISSTFAKGEVITNNLVIIPNVSGWYRCWFPEVIAKTILSQFKTNGNYNGKLLQKNINGGNYICLYIGSSTVLKDRIVGDHLQGSARISTLRKSVWTILVPNATNVVAEYVVTKILENCYWEWEYTNDNFKQSELSQTKHCYPLNVQGNKTMPHEWIEELKKMRDALEI